MSWGRIDRAESSLATGHAVSHGEQNWPRTPRGGQGGQKPYGATIEGEEKAKENNIENGEGAHRKKSTKTTKHARACVYGQD